VEKKMSQDKSQMQQMTPYIIVAGVLVVLLIALVLWPSSDELNGIDPVPVPITSLDSSTMSESEQTANESEVFEPPQMPNEVVIGEESDAVQTLEPVIEQEEDFTLDMSDTAVKAAVVEVIRSPQITKLLVNEALLQKFVINVNNLANQEITIKDNLLTPPEREFGTYNQADKTWIDRSSFQRYTPYIDAVESVDTEELLRLYESYRPTLTEKFAEISQPGEQLDDTVIRAINELLDTPQVPVPIEVVTESVMFKFADPKLEALSGPQKQMIRMGPDNMRRFKEVLRKLQSELEARN
jgi:hypothetical protein